MFVSGTERDPIVIYKLYASQRPANYSLPDFPFYLAPRTVANKTDQMFLRQRIGRGKLMKTMCEKAGIDGKRLTNHSARKHLVQKLRDANIPPTEIMQITGHKNVQSVINYSSISKENQKRCSSIMSSTSTNTNKEGYAPATDPCSNQFSDQIDLSVARPDLDISSAPSIPTPPCPVSLSSIQHDIPNFNFMTNNNTVTSQMPPIFYGAVLNVGSINFFQNSNTPNNS